MEDSFWRWLEEEIPEEKILAYMFFCFMLSALVANIFMGIIFFSGYLDSSSNSLLIDVGGLRQTSFGLFQPKYFAGMMMGLITSAFSEELFFRFFLLIIVGKAFGSLRNHYFILFCSLVFGILHLRFFQIIVTFFCGYIFSLFFLKCGGLQGNYFKALISVTLVHAFYNFYVLVVSFILTC